MEEKQIGNRHIVAIYVQRNVLKMCVLQHVIFHLQWEYRQMYDHVVH